MPDDVFHEGEIAVQERAGERSIARRRAAMIDDRLGDAARAFLGTQGSLAVGVADADGALWASFWSVAPGFLEGDVGGRGLRISTDGAALGDDHARRIIRAGDGLGLVVVDFATRRRLRVNGEVVRAEASGIELRVREVFGNCQKYIQRRERSDHALDGESASAEHGFAIDAQRRALIARADTLFVASRHPTRGVDVSHRGGDPGFVHVERERTLRIPDYPGNSMFQTLGNVAVDDRAGIAFVDFEQRRVLSLTGRARAMFGEEDPRQPTGGTGRYWELDVEQWAERSLPSTTTWTLLERSHFNPHAA